MRKTLPLQQTTMGAQHARPPRAKGRGATKTHTTSDTHPSQGRPTCSALELMAEPTTREHCSASSLGASSVGMQSTYRLYRRRDAAWCRVLCVRGGKEGVKETKCSTAGDKGRSRRRLALQSKRSEGPKKRWGNGGCSASAHPMTQRMPSTNHKPHTTYHIPHTTYHPQTRTDKQTHIYTHMTQRRAHRQT